MTRVLIVGSGSAGQRHVAAVREALPDADIIVLRRAESHQTEAILHRFRARVITELDDALCERPEVAIVASPATVHARHGVSLLRHRIPTLIEKPLATTRQDAVELIDAATISGTPLWVGYHLRFSDTPRALRRALRSGIAGEVRSAEFHVGQRLDSWRPGTEPRIGVSARSELGGGVLLELSHELDAIQWFLGSANSVAASLRFDGAPTDGAVETVADLVLDLMCGAVATAHLDMVSSPSVRRWSVLSECGTLIADLLAGTVELRRGEEVLVLHQSSRGERDRAEHALIRAVLGSVGALEIQREADSATLADACSPADGLAVLDVIEAARVSAQSGDPVRVGFNRDVCR